MKREYGYEFCDFKSHWFLSRLFAMIIFMLYSGYILFAGYLAEFLNEPDTYLIFPSVAFAAIIFAKHNDWHSTGDYMFILGWLYFIGYVLWLLFEETVVYA